MAINIELVRVIRRWNYKVTPSEILNASRQKHIREIEVLALCNLGVGRSLRFAEDLVESYAISSLFLQGGLACIPELPLDSQRYLLQSINAFPTVVCLLERPEQRLYATLLFQLSQAQVFSNTNLAIRTIVNSQSQ